MSDDLSNKIKQITDVLGQEKLPDNLMGLLSLLASSASAPGKEEATKEAIEIPPQKDEKREKPTIDDNTDMLVKVRKVMDRLNTVNDPRINLLNAIRPFMNSKRQKKLNNCINLLRISSLTRYFDDSGKGLF